MRKALFIPFVLSAIVVSCGPSAADVQRYRQGMKERFSENYKKGRTERCQSSPNPTGCLLADWKAEELGLAVIDEMSDEEVIQAREKKLKMAANGQ